MFGDPLSPATRLLLSSLSFPVPEGFPALRKMQLKRKKTPKKLVNHLPDPNNDPRPWLLAIP